MSDIDEQVVTESVRGGDLTNEQLAMVNAFIGMLKSGKVQMGVEPTEGDNTKNKEDTIDLKYLPKAVETISGPGEKENYGKTQLPCG